RDSELDPPRITHHRQVLFARAPEELDLRHEGVKRHVPPPAGSISVVPAGSPALLHWSGREDTLHIHLEPGLVARVAAEAFDLDPARLTVPPLDGLDLPHLRAAMGAVDAELTAGGGGGPAPRGGPGGRWPRNPWPTSWPSICPGTSWRPASRSAGGTARCRGDGSAPSSRTSRTTSAAARAWSSWPRSPASAPTTSRGSSRRPPACHHTSTSSSAASNEPSNSCKAAATCPCRTSPQTPASRTRVSSPITSSASSASPRGSFGCPQESPKGRKSRQETPERPPLPFPMSSGSVPVSRRR